MTQINSTYSRWIQQLTTNGTLELSPRQFLVLAVHYNELSPTRFSTNLLGKEKNYIHFCERKRLGHGQENGLPAEMAHTVSSLFDQKPYADPDFWQHGPITLHSSNPLPWIDPARIPPGVTLHRNHWNLKTPHLRETETGIPSPITPTGPKEFKARNRTGKPMGSAEAQLDGTTLPLPGSPTISVEETLDNLRINAAPPPNKKKTLSVEEEMNHLTFRQLTSKNPRTPSIEEMLDMAVFKDEQPVKTVPRSSIGDVEAALDNIPPTQANNFSYDGKAKPADTKKGL